jgi:acyl-coenzyme A thioesterase PaaI-like protein
MPCATVDMNTSFLKPATHVELTVTANVIRRGRSIVFARAEIKSSRDNKLVVTATGTYAMPPPREST